MDKCQEAIIKRRETAESSKKFLQSKTFIILKRRERNVPRFFTGKRRKNGENLLDPLTPKLRSQKFGQSL